MSDVRSRDIAAGFILKVPMASLMPELCTDLSNFKESRLAELTIVDP